MGLLIDKFRQILTELSGRDTPIFSFPDDNLSKCQGIFIKFSTCIVILRRSGLELLMGKYSQFLTELSAHDTKLVGYYRFKFLFFFITDTFLFGYKTEMYRLNRKITNYGHFSI